MDLIRTEELVSACLRYKSLRTRLNRRYSVNPTVISNRKSFSILTKTSKFISRINNNRTQELFTTSTKISKERIITQYIAMETSTLLLTVLALCICFYYFIMRKLAYFKQLGVPHVRPIPLLGNMALFTLRRLSLSENIQKIYDSFPDVKYFGLYNYMTPTYVIRDPDLINSIAVKNFDYFCDHNNFINEDIDPIAGKILFGMRGDRWREMRKVLSPCFTSSKIKTMFGLISEYTENFVDFLATESEYGKEYDMRDLLRRYTNDVIATSAFGISVDSLRSPNNEFFLLGNKAFNFDGILTIKLTINKHFPLLGKFLGLRMFGAKVENFFTDILKSSIKFRKENGISRPDMIQLMMDNMDKNKEINMDWMTAQALVFFLGGFDTVSSNMCFLFQEIAANPDIQKKLQDEIDNVLRETNGKPTYEDINSMNYLELVHKECLRLYPVTPFLDRKCAKAFELPPATPNGKPVTVMPDDTIWFPNYCIHRDPKYYSEPEKFDPDRFESNNVDQSIYLPFGIGPRFCIGNRFALLVSKIMLFFLLSRCNVEFGVKTKTPIVLSKMSFVLLAEGGFWLKLRGR